jgi:hypothetical protein
MSEIMDRLDLFGCDFVPSLADNGPDFPQYIPDACNQGILPKPATHGTDTPVEIIHQLGLMEKFCAVFGETTIHD